MRRFVLVALIALAFPAAALAHATLRSTTPHFAARFTPGNSQAWSATSAAPATLVQPIATVSNPDHARFMVRQRSRTGGGLSNRFA